MTVFLLFPFCYWFLVDVVFVIVVAVVVVVVVVVGGGGGGGGVCVCRIFFSRADSFWYPFHPRVTAVAPKRSRSCCQTCRWQVTAKCTFTLRLWLERSDCKLVHGCMLYTERAQRQHQFHVAPTM